MPKSNVDWDARAKKTSALFDDIFRHYVQTIQAIGDRVNTELFYIDRPPKVIFIARFFGPNRRPTDKDLALIEPITTNIVSFGLTNVKRHRNLLEITYEFTLPFD